MPTERSCQLPQTYLPDHELIFGVPPIKYDWMEMVYGSPTEEIPDDAPQPKENPVWTSTYCDATLMHDLVTGRSASGILHFLNQTPIDWFSKCQNQVESACWMSLSSVTITAHFHLNMRMNNPGANLSKQSVKECHSSFLLTIDSHHQH